MLTNYNALITKLNKFKSKVILLRHSINTLNTLHSTEEPAFIYQYFLNSPYYKERHLLQNELKHLCPPLINQYKNDAYALKQISNLEYFTLKALKQNYETL